MIGKKGNRISRYYKELCYGVNRKYIGGYLHRYYI